MGVTLYICTSCRGMPPSRDSVPPGRRLAQAVLIQGDEDLPLIPVACKDRCAHGCNAALTDDKGETRIIGGLTPDDAVALIAWVKGGPMPGRLIDIIPAR